MIKKDNDFDRIARWYDFLAKLVFGKSMKEAQTCHFKHLPFTGYTLIIGGGTGWIAEVLLSARAEVKVTYIEASEKMLSLAKKRLSTVEEKVTFIHGTQDDIPSGARYDVLITNFVLDLFDDAELPSFVSTLKTSVSPDGYWIATDFISEKWWHKTMLGFMYGFFRVTSNIRAKRLPLWEEALSNVGINEMKSKTFYGGFIKSKLYRINE